ncbi:hypothetical protein [Dactylosporangium sp. CA-092794]
MTGPAGDVLGTDGRSAARVVEHVVDNECEYRENIAAALGGGPAVNGR